MRLAPKPLDLSDCERLELEQLTNRHNTPKQLALRAKIILLASDGKSHRSIARILDISRHTVRLWQARWLSTRVGDLTVTQRLQDSERAGAPIKFSMEQVMELFALACSQERRLWTTDKSLDSARTGRRNNETRNN